MKITLATYESLSLLHGGPRVQILQTKTELEELGVDVSLMNPWENFDKKNVDLVHLFSANLGTFHLASTLHSFDIPFVTSSIFFTQRSPIAIQSTIAVNKFLKKFVDFLSIRVKDYIQYKNEIIESKQLIIDILCHCLKLHGYKIIV